MYVLNDRNAENNNGKRTGKAYSSWWRKGGRGFADSYTDRCNTKHILDLFHSAYFNNFFNKRALLIANRLFRG